MLRLNIEQERWDHTDSLLARNVAHFSLGNQKLVKLCILWALSQQRPGDSKVPSKLVRIPWQRTRRFWHNIIDFDVAQERNKGILDRFTDLGSMAGSKRSSEYRHRLVCHPAKKSPCYFPSPHFLAITTHDNVPASASDAKSGRQGDLEVLPEGRPLLFGDYVLGLVVGFHLRVLPYNLLVGGVLGAFLASRCIVLSPGESFSHG